MADLIVRVEFSEAEQYLKPDYPNSFLCLMLENPNPSPDVIANLSAPQGTFFSGGATWDQASPLISAKGYIAYVLELCDNLDDAHSWAIERGGRIFDGKAL
jgi:hypothetical protein